jgi:hypothetical protein
MRKPIESAKKLIEGRRHQAEVFNFEHRRVGGIGGSRILEEMNVHCNVDTHRILVRVNPSQALHSPTHLIPWILHPPLVCFFVSSCEPHMPHKTHGTADLKAATDHHKTQDTAHIRAAIDQSRPGASVCVIMQSGKELNWPLRKFSA